jgi:hypothetical protein
MTPPKDATTSTTRTSTRAPRAMTCAARRTCKTVRYAFFQRCTSVPASFSQEIDGQASHPDRGRESVAMRSEGHVRSWPERHPAGHELALGRTVVGWSPRDCTSSVGGQRTPTHRALVDDRERADPFVSARSGSERRPQVHGTKKVSYGEFAEITPSRVSGSSLAATIPYQHPRSSMRIPANLTVRFEFAVHVIYVPK